MGNHVLMDMIRKKSRSNIIWGFVLIIIAAGLLYLAFAIDLFSHKARDVAVYCLFDLLAWACGIFLFVRGLLPRMNVYIHPQVMRLSKYGRKESVFSEIERQFNSHDTNAYTIGRNIVYLGESWVVVETLHNVQFMKATDLLWAYYEEQRGRYSDIFKSTVYHYIILRSKDSKIKAEGLKECIYTLLTNITKNYPWVITGYSKELNCKWENDIGQFTAYADNVKARMGGQE